MIAIVEWNWQDRQLHSQSVFFQMNLWKRIENTGAKVNDNDEKRIFVKKNIRNTNILSPKSQSLGPWVSNARKRCITSHVKHHHTLNSPDKRIYRIDHRRLLFLSRECVRVCVFMVRIQRFFFICGHLFANIVENRWINIHVKQVFYI